MDSRLSSDQNPCVKIGPYERLGELGRGSMGVVYKARSPSGEEVALKLLLKTSPEKLARFERERRLIGLFTARDGFVPLLDAGECAEGPYLVLAFVPGGTLRDQLEEGPLAVAEAIALARALAQALGRAHERGVVHRDLKPENILFTHPGSGGLGAESGDRKPLIADLGIAKHFDRLAPGASQSVSVSVNRGGLRGTAGYMAPEQVADSSTVGPAADVFALGAIVHECLTGRPAFEGTVAMERLAGVIQGTFTPLRTARPSTPPWFATVVERCLAVDPSRRYADGLALLRALDAGERSPGARRLRPLLAAVAGLLTLAGAAWAWRSGAAPPRKESSVAANVASSSATSKADEARTLVRAGDAKLLERNYAGGAADYARAIALDPKNARAWASRARARVMVDRDAAIADCDRAIALDPCLAIAWAVRGTAKLIGLATHEGIADLDQAIALDPGLAIAYSQRGSGKRALGDLEGAIADYDKSIELDPTEAQAWANRAAVRVQNGRDPQGAIADCDQAIALAPHLAFAWTIRGAIKAFKGDEEGAFADSSRALELDPREDTALATRGLIRVKRGDRAGAIADFERFLELAPETERAPRVRAELARLKASEKR